MYHHVSHPLSRRLAALAGGLALALATLCIFLTLSVPSASANEYCWGAHVSKYGKCTGAERKMLGARGYGVSHAVCIGAGILGGGCSGGPNQIVEFTLYNGEEQILPPWIQDRAEGETVVYAEVFN